MQRNAILKVFDNNQVSASGEHTSGCSHRNGVLISGTISSGNECTDHMYQWIEQCAILTLTTSMILQLLYGETVLHTSLKRLGQTFMA